MATYKQVIEHATTYSRPYQTVDVGSTTIPGHEIPKLPPVQPHTEHTRLFSCHYSIRTPYIFAHWLYTLKNTKYSYVAAILTLGTILVSIH